MTNTTGGDHRDTAHSMRPLTLAELAELPAVVDLMTAARALAIGPTKAYDLASRGMFPCHIIKIEGTYRVPTAELHRLLDAEHPHM